MTAQETETVASAPLEEEQQHQHQQQQPPQENETAAATAGTKSSQKKDLARTVDRALVAAEQELDKIEAAKQASITEHEEKKKLVIRNLAEQIESAGIPKDKIASKIIKYFMDAGKHYISRSWLYDCLHDYVNQERSKEISEGRNAGKPPMSATDNSATADDADATSATAGNGGDNRGGSIAPTTSGAVPSGPLGSSNPGKYLSTSSLQSAINELISAAEVGEDAVTIPRGVWNRFTTVAARAEIPAI